MVRERNELYRIGKIVSSELMVQSVYHISSVYSRVLINSLPQIIPDVQTLPVGLFAL